jgi:hypothetical protein
MGAGRVALSLQEKPMSEDNKTNQEMPRIPLIGETAPSFKAQTTQGEISFPDPEEK